MRQNILGEPTELTIELAEAFGGSTLSQEQSRIATILLQRCQVHPQGAQIYTNFRRFIIEHPVVSNQELVEGIGGYMAGEEGGKIVYKWFFERVE